MPSLGKAQKGYGYQVFFRDINTIPTKFIMTPNLLRYYKIMSFFCILILRSLSLTVNFLWSLLVSKSSVSAFHIANKFSFTWKFEKISFGTPSKIILLALATYFFHYARLWESDACGFVTSDLMYSSNQFSSNIASMCSLHATKLEVPSKAY